MIADCVNEHQSNIVRVSRQFIPGVQRVMEQDRENEDICYQVVFGQVYTNSKPMLTDKHGDMYPYFPHEARVRALTYQIDTKVDIHIEKKSRKGNKPGKLIEKYKTT